MSSRGSVTGRSCPEDAAAVPDLASSPPSSPDHARQATHPLVGTAANRSAVRSRVSPNKPVSDGLRADISSDTLRDEDGDEASTDNMKSSAATTKPCCGWLFSPIVLYGVLVYGLVMTGLFVWATIHLAGSGGSLHSNIPSPSPPSYPAQPRMAAKALIPVLPLPRWVSVPTAASTNVTLPLPISVALSSKAPTFLRSTVSRYLPVVFPCTEPQSILITTATAPLPSGTVISIVVHSLDESLGVETNERYTLSTKQQDSRIAIDISAATVYGVMRALESLSQLVSPIDPTALLAKVDNSFLPSSLITAPSQSTDLTSCSLAGYAVHSVPLTIDDWPRVPHRGLLIDTSRHFIPLAILKRMVDGIAAAKMNVLHWHVSDAQSFPMRFDDVPELADKGAYSSWQVYGEKDVREFVEYCRQRGVRVIPEFDIPGHTFSFSHSHPSAVLCGNQQPYPAWGASPPTGQLDPTNPATYDLIKRLATAVYRVFPDAYVHWGHDEINAKCWSHLDGGDTKTTLARFHQRLRGVLREAAAIAGNGGNTAEKKVIVWEEPFTHLGLETTPTPAENTTFHAVQLWVKSSPATLAAIQAAGKHAIVSDSNAWYLDCGQGAWLTDAGTEDLGWCKYRSWQAVYAYNPFPASVSGAPDPYSAKVPVAPTAILGGEVAMWTEQTDATNVMSKVFPRAFAFAERAWADPERDHGWDKEGKDVWEDITRRLSSARERIGRWRGVAAGPLQPEWCEGREADCRFG